jgi:hypothetical protein
MSPVGVATASPPVLGDTVASTSTRAEDNVRKVVKALLAVNEQVKATDLGAHLGIGKTAIYARLRGEKPFTVGEIAVLSEYFRVPVGIFYTGPEALFGNLPESGVGGRNATLAGDYSANAQASGTSTSRYKCYPSDSRIAAGSARLYLVAGGRDRQGAAA